MAVRSPRDPWRVVWQAVVSDGTLALLLFIAAAAVAIAAWFPQVPPGDSGAYAREMSSLQAQFGNTAQVMQTLGLFSITRSWAFRFLAALIAICVVLRTIELASRLLDRAGGPAEEGDSRSFWPGAAGDVFSLASHAGVLLLLAGIVASQVWGWQRSALILQGKTPVILPGGNTWAALSDDGRSVIHSRSVHVVTEEWGPGVTIRAVDVTGQALPLQQRPGAEPVPELALQLIQDPDLGTRDALLAIPRAQLIIRVLPEADRGSSGSGELLVQAYRSPSGELVAEASIGEEAALVIGDVTLEIVSSPYAQITVAYSPGAWLSVLGVLALLGGVLATIGWRTLHDRGGTTTDADAGEGSLAAQLARSQES